MPMIAVAAIAGGAAVATGVVAASTMALVGLGASVVGKITKSKELMQIGAGLSLGTGVVSAYQGLTGMGTAAASEAGASGAIPANMTDAEFDAWAAGKGAAESAIGPDAFGSSVTFDSAANVPATQGLLGSTSSPTQSAIQAPASQTPKLDDMTSKSNIIDNQTLAKDAMKASVAPPGGTDPGTLSKWWAKQPESTKNMLLQMGGSAIGGLFEGWSQEEMMAFQREKQRLEQERYSTAMANANAQPVIARPTSGLLNATRS